MGLTENIGELQWAARYVSLRRTLKPGGIASIVFGALAILFGAPFIGEDPVSGFLAGVGAFLLVTGILMVASPSPGGIIADAIAIIMVGIFNIIASTVESEGGVATSDWSLNPFMFVGVFQLIMGARRFGMYRRFSDLSKEKPAAEVITRVSRMVASLGGASAKLDPSVIEFQEKASPASYTWKGKLLEGAAVFMKKGAAQDVLIEAKEDVSFATQDTPAKHGKLEAGFNIGEKLMVGTISPVNFGRFRMWKEGRRITDPEAQGLREITEDGHAGLRPAEQ